MEILKVSELPVICIEVAYALPERQQILSLEVKQGTTALEAVIHSGIMTHFKGIDLDKDKMGIFSKPMDGKQLPVPKDYVLQEGDRVEIYRPLLIDPKAARAERAKKASLKRQDPKLLRE